MEKNFQMLNHEPHKTTQRSLAALGRNQRRSGRWVSFDRSYSV